MTTLPVSLFVSVGNKDDDADRKVVLTSDAQRFAEQMGIQLYETSAKENKNVEEVSNNNYYLCNLKLWIFVLFFHENILLHNNSNKYWQYTLSWRNSIQYLLGQPASVAQSDVRLTCDQEVASSVSAGSGTIISRSLIMKYFLLSFSPLCCFKKDICQFLAKEYAQILVNCLEN